MRDRIRQGLEEASDEESRSEDERARCRQGVVDLDQAAIQTLHSFASALLHERPLEAGLPPAFETTDEIAASIKFSEAWDAWIDAALEEDSPLAPHLAQALTLRMTLPQLREVALAFHHNYTDLVGVIFLRHLPHRVKRLRSCCNPSRSYYGSAIIRRSASMTHFMAMSKARWEHSAGWQRRSLARPLHTGCSLRSCL